MANGLCTGCKGSLTKENSFPKTFKEQSGYCKVCSREISRKYYQKHAVRRRQEARDWRKNNPVLYAEWNKKRRSSLAGRHCKLKNRLKREGVSKTDLLWNLNFYSAFIKDACCHYCLVPINPTGHGFDRMTNELGHVCFNVVPCCRQCNRIKGELWEYEHMMLLAPKLRRIKQEN